MRALALALLLGFAAGPALADTMVRVRSEAWTPADERGYGEFIDILRDLGEPYAKTCEPVNFGGKSRRATEVPTMRYDFGSLARTSGATTMSYPVPVAVIRTSNRRWPINAP